MPTKAKRPDPDSALFALVDEWRALNPQVIAADAALRLAEDAQRGARGRSRLAAAQSVHDALHAAEQRLWRRIASIQAQTIAGALTKIEIAAAFFDPDYEATELAEKEGDRCTADDLLITGAADLNRLGFKAPMARPEPGGG
jgi:hypothetical protein